MDLKHTKLLFIISNNFRDEELFETKKILESNNIKTFIASKELKTCKGMLGKIVNPELSFDKIIISDFDAIVFVGGVGSIDYWNDNKALNIVKESYLKGKLVCSICLASGILANSGIIKGYRLTGWDVTKEIIEKNKGIYTGNGVEVDGRIITAKGPAYAKEFGNLIVKSLISKVSI